MDSPKLEISKDDLLTVLKSSESVGMISNPLTELLKEVNLDSDESNNAHDQTHDSVHHDD